MKHEQHWFDEYHLQVEALRPVYKSPCSYLPAMVFDYIPEGNALSAWVLSEHNAKPNSLLTEYSVSEK